MEEMRLRHYEAVAAGNMNQAVQEAEALWNESAQQMDAALNDLDGAVNYIVSGANEHPNRIDIVEGKTGPESNQGSAFGQPAAPAHASNPFGQPSQPSQPSTSAFGQPAFGQPSQPTGQTSAFGAPSTLGQSSPFGQTSQSSAFGQPSSLGAGSAFGQPSGLGAQSGLGKPSFGQSGFSQPSAPAFGGTAFGQSSAPAPAAPFGAPSATSPFTQVGQNQLTGGFGQPSGQQAQAPAPFGQPSQPQASPFGQPPAPAPAPAPAQAFGQPSQPNLSPFGQPQPQQQQPSGFGLASSTTSNPFGGNASTQPNPSPFGQPAAPQGVPVAQPVAGPPAAIKIDNSDTLNPFPPLQGETRRDPTSKILTMWKGRPVRPVKVEDGTVRPAYLHPQDNKTLVRVMFPDGPPDDAGLRDALSTPEQMTPEIEEMYNFFAQNGYFKDGVIPPIPPKKEAVSFDF